MLVQASAKMKRQPKQSTFNFFSDKRSALDEERSNPIVQSAPATLNDRSTVDAFLYTGNQRGANASHPWLAIQAIQI
ncbi:MAG: hypothetical protein CMJ60_00980 [Planctomycetaceae bacterium]|nr:hypothetical protein [Planctomycetaceae bacterium]